VLLFICSAEELWQASLKVDPLIEEARAAAAAAANQPAAATARVSAFECTTEEHLTALEMRIFFYGHAEGVRMCVLTWQPVVLSQLCCASARPVHARFSNYTALSAGIHTPAF
jgi:hypothetical protein